MKRKMNVLLTVLSVLLSVFSFIGISASPLIQLKAEGEVDGYVGEKIGEKTVVLRLSDPNYRFEVEDYEDIFDWFPGIPDGLEASVGTHGRSEVYVSFEGIPLEEKEEFIKVIVPDGYIIEENSSESIGDLENTPSEDAIYSIKRREPFAYYDREAIIKGNVGEAIETQYVYVQIENTTSEASMATHVFPEHNGLIPKVSEVLPDNVIVIEYNGIPLEEDGSLIHTLLLDEDLKCDRNLGVPDKEDVRFAIVKKEEVPEEKKEEEKETIPEQKEEEKKEEVKENVPQEDKTKEEEKKEVEKKETPAVHILPMTGVE